MSNLLAIKKILMRILKAAYIPAIKIKCGLLRFLFKRFITGNSGSTTQRDSNK
ncbi:hypothetical protein P262_04211 [Cronobacter malonaticus]|uniref:Uncharacterized protein n=1 Tax=Cronobacter malonaticus TaxID=413503 RepID=V5U1G4_9ENTR|nr:hypothetical protein P262_04211 [Cronobacter malonaticus]